MRSGVKVRLVLSDDSEIVGSLVSARDDLVVLEKNKVRKGRFDPPAGKSLSDPLTFQRNDVVSARLVKGWPFWAKFALWAGIAWAVAGAIAGSIVGNS